ncbi:aspartate carbamoyltransferase catalytic subunit [Marinilactibacillus kalidii]|uniref:aspartate carbamoyltransferase catalytic subunit n=1 Tax=Marinilactibacillus kalidii TaxID=2820274 RepID=UPI001ABE149D|nr:aspartate carbamoyltransferase catalytic subunit [Marinilactibacillus kalidii]
MMSITQNYTKHFLTLNEFEDKQINEMIQRALQFKAKRASLDLSNQYAVNLFFEDSTRTHKSFEMAERKSGMQVLEFTPETSSLKKGETLYDTVKTFEAIGVDMIVVRHSQEAFYNELLERSDLTCSIVNGGDGAGQHPSQSLLDLMTIYEEFNTFEQLKIAIAGDIRHSRVAKSNAMILTRLGAEVIFTGPTEWMDPSLEAFGTYKEIDECIKEVDVFMLLRVQHERHEKGEKSYSKQAYLKQFGLTAEREQQMADHAIVMHPAPVNRGVEIATELVECNRSRIFQQMANGVYARMAIIEYVLNKS